MDTRNIMEKYSLSSCLMDELADDLWDAVSLKDFRMESLIETMNRVIRRKTPSCDHVDQVRGRGAKIAKDIYRGIKLLGTSDNMAPP